MSTRSKNAVVSAAVLALAVAAVCVGPLLSSAETPDVGSTIGSAKQSAMPLVRTGTLDPVTDQRDVYKVHLVAGKRFGAFVETATAGTNFDLLLFSASATNAATSKPLTRDIRPGSDAVIAVDVRKAGWFYLDIEASNGSHGATSTPGTYTLEAAQYPVPYVFKKFSVPSKAKKNAWFTVSAYLGPTYLRTGKPVTLVAQKRVGAAWKHTMKVSVAGKDVAGNATKFSARAKLASGLWRIQARFADVDHKTMTTVWKNLRVK